MKVGFDIGSKNVNYTGIDERKIIFKGTISHSGNSVGAVSEIIRTIEKKVDSEKIESFGITGSFQTSGLDIIDPVIAAVEANRFLETGCSNIFSIGCQSFYLIRLDQEFNYIEHFLNSDCASGTGGFIDQQAERLGFSTEVLAENASRFKGKSPSIATRCAVFAKSDIIHAQAQGFSKDAICAGLCEGVARNVISNTLKGRELKGAILFTGGMSNNLKIVEELSHHLGKSVFVPEENMIFNAVGAAVLGQYPWHQILNLDTQLTPARETRKELEITLTHYPDFNKDAQSEEDGVEITVYQKLDLPSYSVYVGIDVGSTSTKAILLDKEKTILAGFYSRTQGDPVKAVSQLFKTIQSTFNNKNLQIKGVGTTGSGRALIKEILNADVAINEITAHAVGALFIDPQVDTIIEIGGQDSKFTLLQNKEVTSAVMNYVCAAGTGSFIEEQAKRLDIHLDQISEMALGQNAPFTSDRCTVYMERDLNGFLSEGWSKQQIMAAVLFSVRDNYLSKVVGKSRPGNHVYFQGATAKNKALVAAFENELGQPITVSKYCHLTGALGCALAALERQDKSSSFAGMNFKYEISTETCLLCDNQCDLRVYTVNGVKNAWGLKCGRDYNDKSGRKSTGMSQLEKQYKKTFSIPDAAGRNRLRIGIPQTLYLMEYSALFKDFFQNLGMTVVLEKSSEKKLKQGMGMINADFCAPMALAHGLVDSLYSKKVDYIFFPTLINDQNLIQKRDKEQLYMEKMTDAYFCYYSSYAATIVNYLPGKNFKDRILSPKLKFNHVSDSQVAKTLADCLQDKIPNSRDEIEQAFLKAKIHAEKRKVHWHDLGARILSRPTKKPRILLLGRPYTLFDKRINLGIPGKLEEMGFELLSQSMLKPDIREPLPDHLTNMHWFFGQQVLLATEAMSKNSDIYPIFLTCFRCSPDAYLITYFKEAMEKMGKPYLILQLDEHASDVGYLTRIEAALDTFSNDFRRKQISPKKMESRTISYGPDHIQKGDTILIPATDARLNQFQKHVFQACGFDARVLDIDQSMIHLGYRYTSGGECLPNAAILGSLIAALNGEKVDRCILYLPSICLSCNFNQYGNLIKLGGQKAGIEGIRVANSNGLAPIPEIGPRGNAQLTFATYVSSVLTKLYYRYHPYESRKGETKRAIQQSEEIVKTYIDNKKSLVNAAKEIQAIFAQFTLPEERKPRIGILGDIYAKYNSMLNDSVCDYAQSLGGEILMPGYSELILHTMHADIIENNADPRPFKAMTRYEKTFEDLFKEMLSDGLEPDLDECRRLMEEYGIHNFITGETTVSVGRMLYYIKHGIVDAVIHVNPVFCCPGVISSSLFRKIQDDFGIPIIDLFYDGTNTPNKAIVPHIHYLMQKRLK